MKSKYLFLFFLFYCYSISLSAQSNWVWAKNSIDSTSDDCFSVATDPSGNSFITGYFNSSKIIFGSDTLHRNGWADIFVVKYDPLGNVLWAKSFGGSNSEIGWCIRTDFSGNVILTGAFRSPTITFGSTTLVNANSSGSYHDLFIAKLDPNGNVLWAKSAGGISTEMGNGVAADASGNIYLTGYFDSNSINFGTTTLTNANPVYSDFFIVKYDPNGNVLWANRAGGSGTDQGNSVAVDNLGNCIVTGAYSSNAISFGTITLINNSSNNFNDIFIVKYSTAGNVIWAKNAGGPSSDVGTSVATDQIGNIYLTGNFFSSTATFGTSTLTNTGSFDAYLVKYNALGNVDWAIDGIGTQWDMGNCVATDGNGNVFLTGGYSGTNSSSITFDSLTLVFPPGGNNPMFIYKFNTNGNVICGSSLSSGGIASGVGYNSVATNNSGDAIVAGSYWINPFVIGADSLLLTGSQDIFIAKYFCAGNGVSELNDSKNNFSIYPNPSTGIFTLNSEITSGEISITNLLGEIIFTSAINSPTSTIDLSYQPNGIYFVTINTTTESSTQKIILNH